MAEYDADYHSHIEDKERGIRAKAVLDNDTLMGVLAEIEADYVETWKRADNRDADGRETLWRGVKAIEALKVRLEKMVTDGTAAERLLADMDEKETD